MIKQFKIFLISSSSLSEERKALDCLIANENKLFNNSGKFITLVIWEDLMKSFRGERVQDYFNREMLACDIIIALFYDKVGRFTLEEFEKVFFNLKESKNPKYLFVFFKKGSVDIDAVDPSDLIKVRELKKRIENEKQIYCTYTSIDELTLYIRQQIETIIEQIPPNHIRPIGSSLQIVSKNDKAPLPLERRIAAYLDSAYTEQRYMSVNGYISNINTFIDIKDVYVSMRTHIHSTKFDYTIEGMRKISEFEKNEKLIDLSLKEAIQASKNKNIKDLVILGNPGSGKTTLLKYIHMVMIEGKGREKIGISDPFIPFFISLRELRDPDNENLLSFIMRQCKLHDYSITIDELNFLFEENKALVLLDGLDEIADMNIRTKTCNLINQARNKYSSTPFIVTSRYAGYFGESRIEGNILEIGIEDLNIKEIENFLLYWFLTIGKLNHARRDEEYLKKDAVKETSDLLANIKLNPYVQRLAANPLMLQIIASIYKDRRALPQRRIDLYKEYVDVFLGQWDMARNLKVMLSGAEARMLLQPIAFWLHKKEGRRCAPLSEIVEVIQKPLSTINTQDTDPIKMLLNIRDRSGIFMGYNENDFGFIHISLQEYLAAEELRKKVIDNPASIDILIKNYDNRWWREVILLSLSLSNPSIIDYFIKLIIREQSFVNDPSIVIDALKESISQPFEILVESVKDHTITRESRIIIISIITELYKDRAIQCLKDATICEDDLIVKAAKNALVKLGKYEDIDIHIEQHRTYKQWPQLFRAGDPIVRNNEEAFIPRKLVIKELQRQILLTNGCPGIILYARRRMGKSTLLKNLFGFLPKHIHIAFVSMQDPRAFTSTEMFIARLFEIISNNINIYNPNITLPIHFENTLPSLYSYLDKINTDFYKIADRLLIAIDEYENIDLKIKQNIFTYDLLSLIRESIQSHRRITWLFSGSNEITKLINVNWSSYLISARTIEVPLFSIEETTTLLMDPCRNSELYLKAPENRPLFPIEFWGTYTGISGISAIQQQSGGWPHIVQLLAATLVDEINSTKSNKVNEKIFSDCLDKVVVLGHTVFHQLLKKECESDKEWKYLLEFQKNELVEIPKDNKVTRSLLRRNLITEDKGKCCMRVPLMRKWLIERA